MMILYRDIRSISPGYLIFRMSTFSSLVFLFFLSRSHCWTSQTPTAQPTVRPHSSIRKTRESTRRGWRPSWSRAGWMSELLLFSALLSITHSSPSKYFSLSFLPHREKKSRKKKTQQLYQKNLSATLGGGARTTKPEWTLPCLPMHFRETGEGKSILYLFPVFTFILFFYCMMWHKLLLTEFVIYLWLEWCCLCFTDSFPSPPLFFFCIHNLAKKGAHQWLNHYFESRGKSQNR